jgi:hypothetical protein
VKELGIFGDVEKLADVPDKSRVKFKLTFKDISFIDALPHITKLADFCKETWPDIEFRARCIQSLSDNCEIEVIFIQDGDLFRCLPPINSVVKFCQGIAEDISGTKAEPPPAVVPEAPQAGQPEEKQGEKTEKKGEGLEEGLPSKRPLKVAAYSSLLSKYAISIEQGAFMREQTCNIKDIYKVFKKNYPDSIKTSEDIEGFYRGVLLRRGLLATQEGGVWETSEIKTNGASQEVTQDDTQGAPPGPPGDRQDAGQGITPASAREGRGARGGRIRRGDKVRVKIDDKVRFEDQVGAKPPRTGSTYEGTVWNMKGDEILVGLSMGKVWVRADAVTVESKWKEI